MADGKFGPIVKISGFAAVPSADVGFGSLNVMTGLAREVLNVKFLANGGLSDRTVTGLSVSGL